MYASRARLHKTHLQSSFEKSELLVEAWLVYLWYHQPNHFLFYLPPTLKNTSNQTSIIKMRRARRQVENNTNAVQRQHTITAKQAWTKVRLVPCEFIHWGVLTLIDFTLYKLSRLFHYKSRTRWISTDLVKKE